MEYAFLFLIMLCYISLSKKIKDILYNALPFWHKMLTPHLAIFNISDNKFMNSINSYFIPEIGSVLTNKKEEYIVVDIQYGIVTEGEPGALRYSSLASSIS